MPYENLMVKYDVTKEEIREGIETAVDVGKICNINVVLALLDLLSSGDIQKGE